jgi:hypothetical protein
VAFEATALSESPTPNSQRTSKLTYLLPSISDLVFILLFVSMTYGSLAPRLLWDADIGWHIRNGQEIYRTRTIPHTDPFSATMSARPWYAWEWLYDLRIGTLYDALGLNGVVSYNAMLIALALAVIFRLALLRGGGVPVTTLFFLVLTVASSIHFLARPHVFGWVLTVAWLWVLDSSYRAALAGRSYHRIFWLPLIMLVWVNAHGGFVLGFGLGAIYLLGAEVERATNKDREISQRSGDYVGQLVRVIVLTLLASLINPYGYRLHLHVYDYLTNRFLMQHIDEFRAPNLHGLPAQFFLLLVLLTALGVVWARARLKWVEWLLIGFALVSGLWAARNIPVASMVLVLVGAPLFSQGQRESSDTTSRFVKRMRGFSRRMTHIELTLRGHLWPLVVLICTAGILSNHGELFGSQLVNVQFSDQRFPVQAVNSLIQRGNREPIFSLDSWGGYLIYRLYPDVKVLVDDRHDFYGEPFLRDYLKVLHVEPGWDTVLDNLHVNLVLMPTKSKLAQALRGSPTWRLTYEDDTAVVFQRVVEVNQESKKNNRFFVATAPRNDKCV